MSDFRFTSGWKRGEPLADIKDYSLQKAREISAYHRSFSEYCETPLRSLSCLADKLGLGGLYVKDESYRFGLNAFKVLGGSYAIGRLLYERAGAKSFCAEELSAEKTGLKDLTFITATDGNHGRGVAWTAARLGYRSVVYMPECTAPERLENIRALGGHAEILPMPYDDVVRYAAAEAEEKGYLRIQDTDGEGYTEIPRLIMQGYTTLALETVNQLPAPPTHVFLQAGVGSMAGALAAFYAGYYRENRPKIIIVEPLTADCIYRTAAADDGKLHFAGEEMRTIMAGLCCGEPCRHAWELIRDYADVCAAMPDYAAANGMRILASPLGTDGRIVSGESGASGFGLACELMLNPQLKAEREALGLDSSARLLCISTEGDTDRENYRRIVWQGAYSK